MDEFPKNIMKATLCNSFKKFVKVCSCNFQAFVLVIFFISWKLLGWVWSKNGCGHSGLRTLKLAVSQKGINGINLILVCWQKFWKAKSYFNNFWILVIKNGCGLLGLGALKSAVSQEWFDGLGWFFACWYKFMKAKSYFNNYLVGVVKNGWDLKDRGSLKPGISQKWFGELSRLIIWFLHANSDGIIFCSTLYLWYHCRYT